MVEAAGVKPLRNAAALFAVLGKLKSHPAGP